MLSSPTPGRLKPEELQLAKLSDWDWLTSRVPPWHLLAKDRTVGDAATLGYRFCVVVSHYSASIVDLARYRDDRLSLGGWLPWPVLERLVSGAGLQSFGTWVNGAIWQGYSGLDSFVRALPQASLGGLEFYCGSLPVGKVSSVAAGESLESCTVWWPPGREYCVATGPDAYFTIVASDDRLLLQAIERTPDLEVLDVL